MRAIKPKLDSVTTCLLINQRDSQKPLYIMGYCEGYCVDALHNLILRFYFWK